MVAAPTQAAVVGTCIPLAALAVASHTHVAPSEDTWEVERSAHAAKVVEAAEVLVGDAWAAWAVSSQKPLAV